jgi:hypothetical protein
VHAATVTVTYSSHQCTREVWSLRVNIDQRKIVQRPPVLRARSRDCCKSPERTEAQPRTVRRPANGKTIAKPAWRFMPQATK